MSADFSDQDPAALVVSFSQQAAARAKLEVELDRTYTAALKKFEEETKAARTQTEERIVAERAALDAKGKERIAAIKEKLRGELSELRNQYDDALGELKKSYEAKTAELTKRREKVQWEASAVFEAAKDEAKERYADVGKQIEAGAARAEQAKEELQQILDHWQLEDVTSTLWPVDDTKFDGLDSLQKEFAARVATLDRQQFLMKRLSATGWFDGIRFALLLAVGSVLGGAAAGQLISTRLGPDSPDGFGGWVIGAAAGILVVVVTLLIVRNLMHVRQRRRISRLRESFTQTLVDVLGLKRRILEEINLAYKKERSQHKDAMETAIGSAERDYLPHKMAAQRQRDESLKELEADYPARIAAAEEKLNAEVRRTKEMIATKKEEFEAKATAALEQMNQRISQQREQIQSQYEEGWRRLADQWLHLKQQTAERLQFIAQQTAVLFPAWESPSWQDWTPPTAPPPVVPFGSVPLQLAKQGTGIVPGDERLRGEEPLPVTVPALLGFPKRASMLFETAGQGRTAAEQAMLAVMTRLLCSIPPGDVRFTIIDPLGLGQSFAAFAHLADHDEKLVTNRIWTESSHISQRLVDMTEHMEKVIQKYLRNEFATIEEYNEKAGEVAEPFRFLVVANFPANFTEESARRLLSVASSGARCGVYVLVSVDERQPLPQGFSLVDLEQHCVTLCWHEGAYRWKSPVFVGSPLELAPPPEPEFYTPILSKVGKLAKDAGRVQVPFEFITPPDGNWWQSDSRRGVTVPLGRAGATKRQALDLGKGTSQHVLIAGKTGSGKSTLLHALIINLALYYSPWEIELYLIDFKKGVEFKLYANTKLPHARVVAIESEREFGLSVMQRLDQELRVRGELFRDAGVADIGGYRDANPDKHLPRILLIVDEFQEIFTEDDRISQDASLLLDRLVRQGRAFGIHVLLGSQTLGGAYSLARSTLGQMAIRIALQCSEADAHLILSEDNSAARLLSRPGEAIYNDANGLVEGNNPFQIVWIDEARRHRYLSDVRQRFLEKSGGEDWGQIVFEGSASADLTQNPLLARVLDERSWPATTPASYRAWLGDAVAIKDPTDAVFHARSGSNLFIISQQDEAAAGMIVSSVVSLAAQVAPAEEEQRSRGASFAILDSSLADAPTSGVLEGLKSVIPHPISFGGTRQLVSVLGEVTRELEDRQARPDEILPPCFLIVFGLQRFRELRKEEDDFGFGRSDPDAPVSPAKQFANLIKEGAAFGIHVIVWCDSLNNLNRSMDRAMIREFEMRVLMQMSEGDSSHLIDSPAAGRLGPQRALYACEEEGRLEKFRPYGIASPTWLAEIGERLKARLAVTE